MTPATDKRKRLLERVGALNNERSSWITHWREISQYQQPRLGRFFVEDVNKGEKRHQSIYDNTALFSSRTLAAGMMSGMTSPARPWFKLGLHDRDLMKVQAVKQWLFDCETLIRAIFTSSNTYRALQQMYEELGLFGTAANVVLHNFDTVIHNYPLTIGEYSIATNHLGIADTLAREFQMTVGQIASQWGLDGASQTVKNAHEKGQLDMWVPVCHVIEPRKARDATMPDAKNMKFSSVYIEAGTSREDLYLSESGFKKFPALVARWALTGNDIYGSSPGMECLGDVKQLQHEQLRKSQAIDYQVNPPLVVPVGYKDAAKDRLPGGVMYADTSTAHGGIRSAFEVRLDMQHLLMDIADVRNRIQSAYYVPLFMMLANDTRSGVTATEIAERHEEKLLMLGPVLERLQNELLQPLIDIAFDHCVEAGILPPAPKELEGVELDIEFVSVLAQAQKAAGVAGTERLMSAVGSLAQIFPGAVDKINIDAVVDSFAEGWGTNPDIIVPDEVVAASREAKAKAAAAQAQVAAAEPLANAAKTMSETDTSNTPSALQNLQGY